MIAISNDAARAALYALNYQEIDTSERLGKQWHKTDEGRKFFNALTRAKLELMHAMEESHD